MKCCHGVGRKLAFIPLSSLVVGWIVYLIGFCLTITSDDPSLSRFDYIAHYISVAVPLPLVLLASLHAALFGRASSVFGLLAGLLSVFCFTAVNFVLYVDAFLLYVSLHLDNSLPAKSVVTFVGCLVMVISWVCMLVLWNCFEYKDILAVDEEDYAVDEDGTMDPPPPIPKDPPYFAGVARKLAAICLVLQLGCWCLLVAGIDEQINNPLVIVLSFDKWLAGVIGILLIISAFIHAASRGTSSVQIGTFTFLLGMLYLVGVGHVIFSNVISIYHQCFNSSQGCSITTIPRYQLYQLSGGVGTCLLWALVVGLRPFYLKTVESIQQLRIRIRQQRRYLFQNQRPNENIPLFYQSTSSAPAPSAPPL